MDWAWSIADQGGGNPVLLHDGEMPEPIPWIDYPESQGELLTMMAGQAESGDGPAPGLECVDDVGVAQGRLTISLPYVSFEKFVLLQAKRRAGLPVDITPDGGSTTWTMSFLPTGWRGTPISGVRGFSLTMDFLEVG